jgi:2-keto-4-pentenoate hydratase/2-oxohepta-3-ene-1,7-dioic acid hydratase in catechol pathway
MKLASRRNGQPDGQLVVVSRDLTSYTPADPIAQTLQQALDHWAALAPRLQSLADQLEAGSVPAYRFHEREALAPLPRAYQFLDGSAYVNHVELVRQARGAAMPERFWTDPLMYQGCSDHFLAPRDPIPPDELGPSWDGGRLHRPMLVTLNNQIFGHPDCDIDMIFDFPTLIAHAAATRPLMPGSIIGSGTISNRDPTGAIGYACLAERRAVETIQTGAPRTPFLIPGDVVRIEVRGPGGASIFGAIEQQVA